MGRRDRAAAPHAGAAARSHHSPVRGQDRRLDEAHDSRRRVADIIQHGAIRKRAEGPPAARFCGGERFAGADADHHGGRRGDRDVLPRLYNFRIAW